MGVFGLVGLDTAIVSGPEKFEVPDPAYWCAQGYAICNLDIPRRRQLRGRQRPVGSPGGPGLPRPDRTVGRPGLVHRQGRDERHVLPPVAQGLIAAEQPARLAAINPWEGVSDVYRDLAMRGGTPDTGFVRQLQDHSFWGKNRKEDMLTEIERYPRMNDLWENKIPRFDRITVPAYVIASYSNTLHTAGTFRAWMRHARPTLSLPTASTASAGRR